MTESIAVMNWSGGKDSSFALHKILQAGELEVKYLLTTVNEHWQRISMHGVRRTLLKQQAEAIGIELVEVFLPAKPSMEVYESEMNKKLELLVENGTTHSIFGDIFLEDLRDYREKQLKKKNLQPVFPLWKIPTKDLIKDFIKSKFKAITVCVDGTKLDKGFCGRIINQSFVSELPSEVDVCGENGEFHSFVFDAPFFKDPIEIEIGEMVTREYENNDSSLNKQFYFCDLLPKDLEIEGKRSVN